MTSKDKPTQAQLDVILSTQSVCCVSAGAGSGKSYVLALRIMVLHVVLGIPLASMRVVSFTTRSSEDLRLRLQSVLNAYNNHEPRSARYTEDELEDVVTTLNALAFRLASALGLARHEDYYDYLGEREEGKGRAGKLTPEQIRVLRRVHERAYADAGPYRSLVDDLAKRESQRRGRSPQLSPQQRRIHDELKALQSFFASDSVTLSAGEESLHAALKGSDADLSPIASRPHFHLDTPLGRFSPRAVAMCSGRYIHLPPTTTGWERPGAHKPSATPRYERLINSIARYSAHPEAHFFLQDAEVANGAISEEARRRLFATLDGSLSSLPLGAPQPAFQLTGDVAPSPVWEILAKEAEFCACYGVHPTELVVETEPPGQTRLSPVIPSLESGVFARSLTTFVASYKAELEDSNLDNVHELMLAVTQSERVGTEVVESIRHLIIDEFQDVSHEFVSLLRHLHGAVSRCPHGQSSLMAVGDPWQAIYGFRASSPRYIQGFSRYFPDAGADQLSLVDNYRCVQSIIDAAEELLDPQDRRCGRHGRSAVVLPASSGEPVAIAPRPLSTVDAANAFASHISSLERSRRGSGVVSPGLTLFALCRRHLDAKVIESLRTATLGALRAASDVVNAAATRFEFMTFHSAKGLQADYVMILEDPPLPMKHPWRDLVCAYAASRDNDGNACTYSEEQVKELKRLLYVALTRARYGLYWVPHLTFAGSHTSTRGEASQRVSRFLESKNTVTAYASAAPYDYFPVTWDLYDPQSREVLEDFDSGDRAQLALRRILWDAARGEGEWTVADGRRLLVRCNSDVHETATDEARDLDARLDAPVDNELCDVCGHDADQTRAEKDAAEEWEFEYECGRCGNEWRCNENGDRSETVDQILAQRRRRR